MDVINRGKHIYLTLAETSGVPPSIAMEKLASCVSSPWKDINHFLSDLGSDDPLAVIEARSHFNLPPIE